MKTLIMIEVTETAKRYKSTLPSQYLNLITHHYLHDQTMKEDEEEAKKKNKPK